MLATMKSRMTPTELEAYEAFCLLPWDEKMSRLQEQITHIATPSKQAPEQEQKQEQHSAENIAEKATSSTVNTSLFPTTPQQAIEQHDGEPPHSSKVHGCNSFRLRFLMEPCYYTVLASQLAYIRFAKEMEPTGQG